MAIKRVLADELDEDNETATKNLLKEATALSSVQHPHICTVYDAGVDEDGPFVVMELINGKTLDEMVERGTLTYEDFREVAIQTQEAMIAAQELNLVHRDLKPSNVMVSWLPSGRFQIKLVDFGLAKFSAKPSLQTIDHGDAVFGSIFFMAPEQFERTALDQRTDMYSLGSMFYYALTGNYPFDGETAPQVMASHLQNTVIPLQQARPDLPVWLSEWVMWHIQRDMNHRPPSAKLALDKFLADESLAAQGGMGQTQQLITPAAPILRKNTTGPVAVNAASNITGPLGVLPAKPTTAPQPILSPDGIPSPSTAPVAIRPAGNIGVAPVDIAPDTEQAPEAPPEVQAPPKKTISKTTLIVIGSMLAVALVIMCFVLFGAKKESDHQEVYARLIKDIEAKETLPVTKAEMDNLLTSMVKNSVKDKIGGYFALSKAEAKDGDFSPTLETAKFVNISGQNLKDEALRKIFRAIASNPNHDLEAHKLLLKYAIDNPDKPQSSEAIGRMKKFADDSFIDDILAIYDKTTQITTRTSCALTLGAIIKRSKTKSSIAATIIDRYNKTSDEDQKLAYMRIVGTTGSPEALTILKNALKHKDIKYRIAAMKALANSPTIEPIDAMLEVFAAETNESHNKKYRTNIFDLLENNTEITGDRKIQLWTKFINVAPTPRSKKQVIGRVAGEKHDWTLKLIDNMLASPEYDDKIKEFLKKRLQEWAKKK